jgi:TRAP-type C4-dicarboxylate transport system permease small subunit
VQKVGKTFSTILNIAIALSLALMAILVFGNVVLRYAFNSGITWSEEMSRFLFVWMVFLGAIAALKDNMHLGMDIVINFLPKAAKKAAFLLSNALVLYVLWLLLDGSWKMTVLNMNSTAPATGMPLSYLYGIGIVTSISMAVIILINLYRALFFKDKNTPLAMISQTDEVVQEVSNVQDKHYSLKMDRPSEKVGG